MEEGSITARERFQGCKAWGVPDPGAQAMPIAVADLLNSIIRLTFTQIQFMADQFAGLTGGTLIIGSLLWQDDLREPGDHIRKNWRRNHLDVKQKVQVFAPIRYGRLSGNVITMVFSQNVRTRPGTAWAVPFTQPIKDNGLFFDEVQALSIAEGMGGGSISIRRTENNVWEAWSVVGLLLNNKRLKPARRKELLQWWDTHLSREGNFKHLRPQDYRAGKERSCLTPSGGLNLPWIKTVNKKDERLLDQFDFLLVTATLTNFTKYPTPIEMARNVKEDNVRNYFQNNYKNKITTWQDEKILAQLGAKKK